MSLVEFLYKYLYRGIGIVLLAGMLTILYLAIRTQMAPPAVRPHAPSAHRASPEGRTR